MVDETMDIMYEMLTQMPMEQSGVTDEELKEIGRAHV